VIAAYSAHNDEFCSTIMTSSALPASLPGQVASRPGKWRELAHATVTWSAHFPHDPFLR
jgi:hypothetical protein